MEQYYGTGRRKRAVARVFLRPGTGRITINRRDFSEYFNREIYKTIVQEPLKVTRQAESFDVIATIRGGGNTGQAGALRHGLSRALVNFSEGFRVPLRKAGFLTRDAREVERKKHGMKGARARYQFSKR